LRLNPAALNFAAVVQTRSPGPLTLEVSNAGGGVLIWRFAATTFNGGQWLRANPESGSGSSSVTVSADLAGLAAGTYAGRITFTAEGASNSRFRFR